MSLTTGTRFGPYEIVAPIGAGGMGEVYRARDTKLKRDVALKVLPDTFAGESGRMSRFQREAEVLASLNHPNIAHIYGVEERALAMELVEGESPRGPMPFDEAWKVVSQIADALEYAHDKGVVHRDLKPANVKVTPEGTVKLLDFGLAKAFDVTDSPSIDPSDSPTLSLSATVAGTIVGTPGYMAPEQAKGKTVDKRADIWAWGVLFHELLTGKPLFQAEDASETLAQVLTKQPDFERVPRNVRPLLQACLQKDPRQRLRDIGDAKRLVTDDVLSASPVQTSRRARLVPWFISLLTTLVAAIALWLWLMPTPQQRSNVIRFTTAAPISSQGIGLVALSPDGSHIAFVGGSRRQIYVRAIDDFDSKPLPGTEDSSALSFSPDGEWISYVSGSQSASSVLKKISVSGAQSQMLAGAPSLQVAPTQSWGEDNYIYFSSDSGLQRVSSIGNKAEAIAAPDSKANERAYVGPQLLPDGQHLLVSSLLIGQGPTAHRVFTLDLRTHEKKTLLEGAGVATVVPTSKPVSGHILYYDAATGSLMALPIDLARLQAYGSAVPILEGVRGAGGMGTLGISRSGTLAYAPGSSQLAESRTLVWVDRQGMEQPALCPASRMYGNPRLSPDEGSVVVEIQNPARGQADIWICDLKRGSLARITSERTNIHAAWTYDGKRVVYYTGAPAEQGKLVWAPTDGGQATELTDEAVVPDSASSNGVIALSSAGQTERSISFLSVEQVLSSGTKPRFLDLKLSGTGAQFSPDGKFIAYQSRETGRPEIYVRAFPGLDGKTAISTDGGINPRWSHTGELFYRNGNKMMSVAVQTTPTFRVGKVGFLFEKAYANTYDVSDDGKRFLMIKGEGVRPVGYSFASEQLNVVVGWFEELRQRAPWKEK